MVKIKKLLGDTFPEFIDLFYGIMATWTGYYRIFVGVVGIYYLFEIFPSNILRKTWGEIPQGFVRVEIQKGTFSIAVMNIFLIFVVMRMIALMLGIASKRAKGYSVYEILVGSILVSIQVHLDPIVTFDKILIFSCYYILIKWGLIAITRVFKISTRHFGSIKTEVIYLEFPILGNKEKEEAGSSE